MELLESLKCQHDELDHVPSEVQDLAAGGNFTLISSKIIPYVQLLLKKITSSIGEGQLKTHGQEMIKIAKSIVINDPKLLEKFELCLDDIKKNRVVFESTPVNIIRSELSEKVFNARINEFFKARKELELETSKKVVDCGQSLRDTLKTFSSLKSRD